MHLTAARVLVCCGMLFALIGVGLLPATVAAGPAVDSTVATQNAVDEEALEAYDDVRIEIELADDGSAMVTVQYQYRLNETDSEAAWTDLESAIEDGPESYTEWSTARWEAEAAEAEEATGREMEISDVTVETETQSGVQELGFVVFEFEWSSFGMVELNRLEAGEALDGFVLEDDMQLVLSWPAEYERSGVEPSPDDTRETAVIWNGEDTDFVDSEPRLELIERNDEPLSEGGDTVGVPMVWLASGVGVGFVVAAVLLGWWVLGHRGTPDSVADDAAVAPAEAEPGPPPELLSNEERVLRLIDDNGGRIKQQEVVAQLEWTEAKTSQVVSSLREDDQVEVFRIGRENVLTRPTADETDSV